MPALTQATTFNAEATLNAWLESTLATYTLPSWLTALPRVTYDWSQIQAVIPCFAVAHLPVGTSDAAQGRQVGSAQLGLTYTSLMEVSVFVSKNVANWYAQARTMTDFVLSSVTANPRIIIRDYQGNLSTPAATPFAITLTGADVTPLATEANNAGIARQRILISTSFVYRAV